MTTNPYRLDSAVFEVLASADIADSYAFNMCILWRHNATGRLFYGFDSGCSCPSPFEDDFFEVEGKEIRTSLEEVTARNWEGAANEMESRGHFERGEIRRILAMKFR